MTAVRTTVGADFHGFQQKTDIFDLDADCAPARRHLGLEVVDLLSRVIGNKSL